MWITILSQEAVLDRERSGESTGLYCSAKAMVDEGGESNPPFSLRLEGRSGPDLMGHGKRMARPHLKEFEPPPRSPSR